MSIIFLTAKHSSDQKFFAIEEGEIETLEVSKTYDEYGQQISASDAGDYLYLNSDGAVEIANEASETEYEIGAIVSAYEDPEVFGALVDEFGADNCDDITFERETCKGFNFHNGRNWQTIVVESNTGDGETHDIVADVDLIQRLNVAIENKEFESENFGRDTFRHENTLIIRDYSQGAWEQFRVEIED